MKKSVTFALLGLLSCFATMYANNNEGISYYPVIAGLEIPESARQSLMAKMEQIITKNGYGTKDHADRFVMLAKCNVLEKDVAPTTPPRIAQTVEITFILGDAGENKTFASTSVELKGIGTNESKAWQTSFNRLKADNASIAELFRQANTKIEEYYSANCQRIIDEARTLAATGEYEQAIANLMSVPDICGDCYKQTQTEALNIYQKMLESKGSELLAKARNAWAIKPDLEGAKTAMEYISSIPLESSSYTKAEDLIKAISDKLSSDNEREWQLMLKKYEDNLQLQRSHELHNHQEQMASIAAAKSVAEKWAENQPQTKIYLNW